jgi:hypothetical protein
MEAREKVGIFSCVQNLTYSFNPACSIQNFSDDWSASPYNSGKVINLVGIPSVSIDNSFRLQLNILVCGKGFNAVLVEI